MVYKFYYDKIIDVEVILGIFFMIDVVDSKLNGFINEFIGIFLFVLGVISMMVDKFDLWVDFIGLGFLVMCLVIFFGGLIGLVLNFVRDIGLWLFYVIWLFEYKGSF